MPPPQAPTAAPISRRPGWQPPVWLPWVSAPLFFLLPIGGCGAAAIARRPAPPASATAVHPLPGPAPVATVVTVLTPRR